MLTVAERLTIDPKSRTADWQAGSFANATLQDTGKGLSFSVAVHVEVPTGAASTDENVLRHYLASVFTHALQAAPEIHVEIQIGPTETE